MQARGENKYVKLGMVVLKTKKKGYQAIKEHIQKMNEIETYKGRQQQRQQQEVMGEPDQKELLTNIKAAYNKFYQIQCQSNEQITWKNTYYLILDKNNEIAQTQQLRIKQKPTTQGWDWSLLSEKNITEKNKIQIEYSSSMINNLMNLIHRGQIKLCNPYPFEEPSRINMQNDNENEKINIYYISNLQSSFSYEIGFQVWVEQLLLIKMNSNFQRFSIQSQHAQEQKIMNERYPQNKLEQQFINIVRQIFNEQTLKQDKNGAQNIIKSRTQMFFSSYSIGFSQYNSQQIKPYVTSQNHKQQGNFKNNVMSLNFAGEKNQAGIFFDLIQKKTPQAKKPEEFSGDLKSYQARALTWMLIRQGVRKDDIGIDMSHVPFWWDIGKDLCLGQKMMINTYLNFVTWKKVIDKSCQGGILADEMGLGKTIMIIALILANRPSKKEKTLIISPLSVVKQWKDQINKFAPTLRVHVMNQSKISEFKLESCDVVISTQGKIRSSMKKQQQDTNLLKKGWFRIVIDEAHNFKNSGTQMAKSIYQIESKNRWCLTGTPTQNSISDLFSLIKFLRFKPWCSSAWWNKLFPKNVKHIKPYHFTILKNLLKGILLRRKKESVDDEGKKLIQLPEANVKVHFVEMNEQAKYLYQLVDYRAKISLKKLQKMENKLKEAKLSIKSKKNINEAKKLQYNYILSLMMKMRMICCHQFLSSYRTQYVTYENFSAEYLRFLSKNNVVRYPRYNFFQLYFASSEQKQKIRRPTKNLSKVYENWDAKILEISNGKTSPCLICNCSFEEAVITPCVHTFCRRCIQSNVYSKWKVYDEQNTKIKRKKLVDFQSVCPHCEDNLCLRQLFSYPRLNEFNRQFDEYKQNGKMRALLQYLKKMNPSDKALIFSSFIGMMTLIGYSLRQNGFTYLVIQGHDSYESRHEKIKQFNTNPNIKILILTLKIGSVGLNMEAANKVFFMDPWWNPAIQEQAVGRVHRIGQKKQVEAIKFITQQSIEARILKLSLIKKEVNDSVLDIDDIVNDKRYSKTRFEIKYLLSMQETLKQQSDSSSQQNEIKCLENNFSEDIYQRGLKMLIEKQKIKIQQDFSNLNGIVQVSESKYNWKDMQKQQISSFSSIEQEQQDEEGK